jgi:carboxyl-terminal processing protease
VEEDQIRLEKNKILFKKFVFTCAVIILVAASFWFGFFEGRKVNLGSYQGSVAFKTSNVLNQDAKSGTVDFSQFWKVWDLLREKYVDADKLDAQNLLYGAIKGMMQATGDPYTMYFNPKENKEFNEDITGTFEGIGAEMGIKNDILTIIAPLQGSPAEKAGLRSGDKILKIDDNNSADMGLAEAVSKIRGTKGTDVKLTILRNGEKETQDITVKRDVINVKSVSVEFKENNIAYVNISRFAEDTSRGFNDAVSQVIEKKSKGLIIDLRNDPGGYLDSAISVAGKMLPKNQVVVIEENGNKEQKKISTQGGDMLSSIPTVILINEGSASASEILAGALKDNRENVTLVGKKSFGKGSVQELIDLPQGTAAKITVARWLTPKGQQINEVGISPDVEVDLTNEDYNNDRDPQLDKAIQIIQDKTK